MKIELRKKKKKKIKENKVNFDLQIL